MRLARSAIVVGMLLLGAVVVPYTREFLAADSCLDGGGSFDYTAGACDHDANHAYVPFTARHRAATPVFLGGSALILIGLFWRRRNHPLRVHRNRPFRGLR